MFQMFCPSVNEDLNICRVMVRFLEKLKVKTDIVLISTQD